MERIGKYRVIGKLGQGGMARVFLTMVAGPHDFNKLMVVKELKEELAQDGDFLPMFLDEGRLAARLNHPNVVQTYDVGQDGDRFFIAMEYLEGQPLNAILRRIGRGNLPIEIHVRILAEMLAGLEYAHHMKDFDGTPLGVVHRDVSPQNVFVTYDGQVKVVDFGIAKAAGASTATRTGVFKGKLSYVAPEQARGQAIDARADLFAVGVMLWEAIAARRLVNPDGEAGILARRMSGQDPKIMEIVPDAPMDLAQICDKAMAPVAADRYQSAREFQEALEDYLDRSPYRTGPKEVGSIVLAPFAIEREKIRKLVDEQVKKYREAPDEAALPIVDITGGPAGHEPTPTLNPHPVSVGSLVGSQVSQPAPPPEKKRGSLVPFIAVAILAIGVAGFFLIGTFKSNPSAAAPSPNNASSSAPASGDQIQVKIAYPLGARAKLDGAKLDGNPFVATVAKDSVMHRIDIEQDGFAPERKMILFDKDIDLAVALSAAPGTSAAPPPADSSASPKVIHHYIYAPAATSTPTTTPATPPPTSTEDNPRPRPRPTVELDDHDPYKKKP